jgi:hypothetical protein
MVCDSKRANLLKSWTTQSRISVSTVCCSSPRLPRKWGFRREECFRRYCSTCASAAKQLEGSIKSHYAAKQTALMTPQRSLPMRSCAVSETQCWPIFSAKCASILIQCTHICATSAALKSRTLTALGSPSAPTGSLRWNVFGVAVKGS